MLNDARGERFSPAAKLGAYSAVLALLVGGGALAGSTFGPDAPAPSSEHGSSHGDDADPDARTATAAAGTTVTAGGYTLDLRTPTLPAGTGGNLELDITDRDGHRIQEYEVEHDEELHLVVVGRDLRGYAHVHPSRDPDGRWSVELPGLEAGSYRVFADFVPGGDHDGVTLGSDLTVLGDVADATRPEPGASTTVDDYDVTFDGRLVAGGESTLTVTVSRDGVPVADLDPYLGALGHLVAVRDGDLAYLHVHPLDEQAGPGGPAVRFAVEVPSAGSYGLFFDFSHLGVVRTAQVVTAVAPAPSEPVAHDEEHRSS